MADMVEGVRESQVIRLIAALESDDEVVEPILRRVRSEIPSYQAVGREQIVASVDRILRRVCRTLWAGEVPPPDEFWEAERATVERLGAGVPIEDIMAGFRVTIASIQGRLVELAVEGGVDGADVVALTSLLWRLSDAFSARAAAASRMSSSVNASETSPTNLASVSHSSSRPRVSLARVVMPSRISSVALSREPSAPSADRSCDSALNSCNGFAV